MVDRLSESSCIKRAASITDGDRLVFLVETPVFLCGVRLLSAEGSVKIVRLTLINELTRDTLQFTETRGGPTNQHYWDVLFNERQQLEPNTHYELICQMDGETCSGSGGKKKQTIIKKPNRFSVSFYTSQNSANGTTVYVGQFYSLIFM